MHQLDNMKRLIFIFLLFPLLLSAQTKGTFVDSRDNQTYKWVKIGEQTWMGENLNYNSKGSVYYNNDSIHSYGRLYNYESMMGNGDSIGICPEGWHIPSLSDWNKLLNFTGKQFASDKLKSKTFKGGNDTYGFNALPNGRYLPPDEKDKTKSVRFENQGTHSYFWSSTERDGYTMWSFFLYSEASTISKIDGDKNNGMSIRCIKK